jgi:hypothetical protein
MRWQMVCRLADVATIATTADVFTNPTHHGNNRLGPFADAIATSRQSNVSANIISTANSRTRKVLLG